MRQLQSYLKSLSKKSQFPSPELADEDGLLCFGGELFPEILLDAYYHGIFPWPHKNLPMLWFAPKQRGVLFFEKVKVPKSLKKTQRNNNYVFSKNKNFRKVVEFCGEVKRKGQEGTWITKEIVDAYCELHSLGFASSYECWDNEVLIGGLYGVDVAGVFSGESMFGLKTDVSKLVLLETVRNEKALGKEWMDIQMVTPVMELLGGEYVTSSKYLEILSISHKKYWKEVDGF